MYAALLFPVPIPTFLTVGQQAAALLALLWRRCPSSIRHTNAVPLARVHCLFGGLAKRIKKAEVNKAQEKIVNERL